MNIFLRDVIHKKDEGNNSISRKDTIQFIVDLGGACSDKQAENFLDYLIRMRRIDRLKRNGRFVAAQGATTEISHISVAQKYRWHYIIESE